MLPMRSAPILMRTGLGESSYWRRALAAGIEPVPRRAGDLLLLSPDLHSRVHDADLIYDADGLLRGEQTHGLHELDALVHRDRIHRNFVCCRVAGRHGMHDGG